MSQNFFSNKYLKKFLTSIAIFALFIALGNILIDNPYTSRIATNQINKLIETYAPVNVEFQAVSLRLFPPRVKIFGVKSTMPVEKPADPSRDLLEAEAVDIGVSLKGLLFGSSKLAKIVILGLKISRKSLDNLKILSEKLSSTSPTKTNDSTDGIPWESLLSEIPVAELRFEHCRFEWANSTIEPEDSINMSVGDFNLNIEINDRSEINFYTENTSIDFAYGKRYWSRAGEFSSQGKISPSEWNVQNLTVRSDHTEITSSASGKVYSNNGILEKVDGYYNYKVESDIKKIGAILDDSSGNGNITLIGDSRFSFDFIASKIESLKNKFSLNTSKLTLDDFGIGDLTVEGNGDLESVNFSNIHLLNDKTKVIKGSGSIQNLFTEPKLNLNASAMGLSLEQLLEASSIDFDDFQMLLSSESIDITGTFSPFKLDISTPNIELSNLELLATKNSNASKNSLPILCHAPLSLNINIDELNFEKTNIKCTQNSEIDKETNVSFHGLVTFEIETGMDLQFSSKALNLSVLAPLVGIETQGETETYLQIHGPYSAIVLDIDAKSKDANGYGVKLDALEANLQIKDGKMFWTIPRAHFAEEGVIRNGKGSLDFQNNLLLNASVPSAELSYKTVDYFSRFWGLDYLAADIISLESEIRMPLESNSFVPEGYLRVEAKNVTLEPSGSIDWLKSDLVSTPDSFIANELVGEIGSMQFSLQGKVSKKKVVPNEGYFWRSVGFGKKSGFEFNLKTKQIDSSLAKSPFIQFPYLATYTKPLALKGSLSGFARGHGTLVNPIIRTELDLIEPSLGKTKISNLRLEGLVENQRADVILTQLDNSFSARYKMSFAESGYPFSWYVKARRWNISPWVFGSIINDARNYIYLTASSEWQGNLSQFKQSNGNLNFEKMHGRIFNFSDKTKPPIDLKNQGTYKISFKDELITSTEKSLVIDGNSIKAKFSLVENSTLPFPIGLNLEGRADINFMKSFIKPLETAEGEVDVSGKIGILKTGEFKWNFDLKTSSASDKRVSLGLKTLRPPLTNIQTDISVSDQKLEIKSFRSDKGSGSILASGTLNWGDESNLNSRLEIDLNRAGFIYDSAVLKTIDIESSGNLSISLSQSPILVAGDLRIDRARTPQSVDIRDKIFEFIQSKKYEQTTGFSEPIVNFDLNISAVDSIKMRNRNISADASANLILKGNDVKPILTGTIEVNRGSFAYKYRRDFDITQGLLTFDDPVTLDPKVDLTAVAEISSYRITMSVSGKSTDPRIDLSCDPSVRPDGLPVSKLDILMLLASGNLTDQTRSSISAQDAAAAEAINILAGKFEEPVEKFLDWSEIGVVRQVYIDAYASEDGAPVPRFNVPLDVHEDWDVVFRVEESSQELTMGYNIDESISLDSNMEYRRSNQLTDSAPQNDTGVDLKFRFSY